jgi:hypothetical protein
MAGGFDRFDTILVTVSRDEVVTGDVSGALSALRRFIEEPEIARQMFERVDVAFHGYDQDSRELFEIPDVRNFVYKLDNDFPFWLFFLNKHCLGLQAISLCFLPPFLTPQGKQEEFPKRMDQLLQNRWFPAMNQICEYASFDEDQIEELTERVFVYLTEGPLPFHEE